MNKNKEEILEKEPDNLESFLDNEKVRAGLKLLAYLLFFLIFIVYANGQISKKNNQKVDDVSSSSDIVSSEEVSKEKEENKFELYKNKLLENNYEFTFTIYKKDVETIKYTGTRNLSTYTGYKTTALEFTKFIIEDGKVYEERLNTKVESSNVFKNLDMNFLDSEYILRYIENYEPEISKEENTEIYSYDIDSKYQINIKLSEYAIYEIEINFSNKTYDKYILNFK